MRLDLKPVTALTDEERAALRALTEAVYPPESLAASPGRSVRWAPVQWSILVWVEEVLVAHAGLVVREGALDGAPVTIGGVGSVKTHPRCEGQGYASAALRCAATALETDHHVVFSLLVCQSHLLPFYARLGWRAFPGQLVVEQPDGPRVFTVNQPMVLGGLRPPPGDGVIDLRGMPW
ncbi:MAG TPA: GNAT family N-acetyltransferase [Methylomirabilota bacterium]